MKDWKIDVGSQMRSACKSWILLLIGISATNTGSCGEGVTASQNYDPYIRARTPLGPVDQNEAFGDSTDLNSGATNFYVTVASVPGDNDLELALRYKYVRDRWFTIPRWNWERDDPYLTGDFARATGWVVGTGTPNNRVQSTQRCSMPNGYITPPVITGSTSRGGEFHPKEYWAGYRLVLPRGGGSLLNPLVYAAPSQSTPIQGGPYKWATNEGWFFSCIPLKNGNGEGFLALSPQGTKYFFDDYRLGPELLAIDKQNSYGQEISLERQEIRIYASRIEDRFGNYIEGLNASDGRSISVAPSESGTINVAAGTKRWTVALGEPFTVTQPDGAQWSLASNWKMTDSSFPGTDCSALTPSAAHNGTGTVVVTLPSGVRATFNFAPILRGYSHVPMQCDGAEGMNSSYVVDPSTVTEVALISKTISGAGIPITTTTLTYGAPNGCYGEGGNGQVTCTASSPTFVTTQKTNPDGSYVIYTFGNRYGINQGMLLKTEEGTGLEPPLRTTLQDWQLLEGIGTQGHGLNSRAGALASIKRIVLRKKVIIQQGRLFSWEVASNCGNGSSLCLDAFARPTKLIKANAPAP